MMASLHRKALMALILALIALSTFFMDFQTSQYTMQVFWMADSVLYRVTIPLIVASLILNSIALVQAMRERQSVLFEALVFALYVLFLIVYFLLTELGIVRFAVDHLNTLQ